MEIEVITIRNSSYVKIQIVEVITGQSQTIKDGKWVDAGEARVERTIVELGKCFDTHAEASKYIETKPFKALLKLVSKGNL